MSQSTTSGSLRFPVNEMDIEDMMPSDPLEDPDDLVETTNLALSLGRSVPHPAGMNAPGFEIPTTREMEDIICNKWNLILGE